MSCCTECSQLGIVVGSSMSDEISADSLETQRRKELNKIKKKYGLRVCLNRKVKYKRVCLNRKVKYKSVCLNRKVKYKSVCLNRKNNQNYLLIT